MSTEISTNVAPGQLLAVAQPENADLAVIKTRAFLPMLRHYGGSSTPVKKKLLGLDHYALTINKELIDCGEQVKVIPIAWRYSATILGDKYYSNYDYGSARFNEIQVLADAKTDGHLWGFDYLCWLIDQQKFAIVPLNNPTNRNIHPNMKERLGLASILDSADIDDGKNQWRGMTVAGYIGQIDHDALPPQTDQQIALGRFQMKGETTAATTESKDGIKADPNAPASTRG